MDAEKEYTLEGFSFFVINRKLWTIQTKERTEVAALFGAPPVGEQKLRVAVSADIRHRKIFFPDSGVREDNPVGLP